MRFSGLVPASLAILVPSLLVTSCSPTVDEHTGLSEANKEEFVHPLDLILGDKVIDPDSGETRPNNFEDLIGFREQDIASGSVLYDALKINDSLYILDQTKTYTEARAFSLVLKVRDSLVTDYFVLHDQRVVTWHITKEKMTFLCDDSRNHNLHWKSTNNLLLVHLDASFNELWCYTPKPSVHPIRARGLRMDQDLEVQAEVVTGCSICFSIVELKIDPSGSCSQVHEVRLHNSSHPVEQEMLNSIFL